MISRISVFCGKLPPAVMCHVPVLIEKPSSAVYTEKNNLPTIAAAASSTTTTRLMYIHIYIPGSTYIIPEAKVLPLNL